MNKISTTWSADDLRSFLKTCSTSFKIVDGRITFRACAILDSKAQPIPIDEFMIASGQRKMIEPRPMINGLPIPTPKKSETDRLRLNEAVKGWRETYGCSIFSSTARTSLNPLKDIKEMVILRESLLTT